MAKTTKTAKTARATYKMKAARAAKTSRAIRAANVTKPSAGVRLAKALLIAAGTLILLATAASLLFVNFNFGVVMLIGGSAALILYGLFFEKLIKLKWLSSGIIAVCIVGLAMMVFIGVYGLGDNAAYDEEALVVLGAGIRGERVSLTLARRLDKAAAYYAENPDAVIVVSGARGPQEDITEALAMERYLVDKGVPGGRILKEEAATSTYENFVYTKEILDRVFDDPYRIVIVTNEFHMFRAERVAGQVGLSAARLHSKTEWYEIPRNYLRECVAIFKYWILRR